MLIFVLSLNCEGFIDEMILFKNLKFGLSLKKQLVSSILCQTCIVAERRHYKSRNCIYFSHY